MAGEHWERQPPMLRMSMIRVGPRNAPCMRKLSQPQFIRRWVSITRRFVTTIRSVADLNTSRKTKRGWAPQSQSCSIDDDVASEPPCYERAKRAIPLLHEE